MIQRHTFIRDSFGWDFYGPDGEYVCSDGLHEFFEIPEATTCVTFCVGTVHMKQSYRVVAPSTRCLKRDDADVYVRVTTSSGHRETVSMTQNTARLLFPKAGTYYVALELGR